LLKIKETNHKLTKYWIRVPIAKRKGGLWLPIKPHQPIDFNCEFCESKILKKGDDFFIYIVVKKEVEIKQKYSSILTIDLGEKVIATVLLDGKPIFYGKEIRGIRRHYAWLRKRLGEKKLLKEIKRIGDKEKRAVNQKLHEISKGIVSLAYQHDSLILLGDLKGIRKSSKGKRMNRIVSNMPYYKLVKYIEYKAGWEGIKTIKFVEKHTSHICSRCGSEGKRVNQGLFKCPNCRYQVNADYNGVKNILNRFLEYISKDGAAVNQSITLKGEAK